MKTKYYQPTPAWARKLGDAFMAVAAYLIIDPTIFGEKYTKWIALGCIFIKALSNTASAPSLNDKATGAEQ